MKKFKAYIKILRPLNLMIGAFAVVITASILNSLHMVFNWVTALVVVVLCNGAANALNDYFDLETDKINRPNRPLVTGALLPRHALTYSIILFCTGILLSFALPYQATIIAILIALPLMTLYNVWFKRIPLLGNFVIAFVLGITFLFAGAALNNINAMYILAILAVGLTMVRELIKDIADYEGDKKANISTYPVVFGVRKAWVVVALLAIMIGGGAIIPYQMGAFNNIYLAILILGIEIPLAISVFFAMKFPTIDKAKKMAVLLKFSTLMGVFAFWLGSV